MVSLFTGAAQAITNGTPDGENHPYVCIVVFFDAAGNPLWYTTGTLISPTIVLTAGHGTFGTTTAKVWFETNVGTTGFPYNSIYQGTPFTCIGYLSAPTGKGVPTSDYHDVGIVRLSTAVQGITPAQLPGVGSADKLPMKAPVDLLGYGAQVQQKGSGVSPYDSWRANGYRYYASAQVITSKGVLSGEFMEVTANPGQDKGGIAFGDSGGPIFKAGTNIIIGINSFVTNSNCAGVTYAQRIDIADILGWIEKASTS